MEFPENYLKNIVEYIVVDVFHHILVKQMTKFIAKNLKINTQRLIERLSSLVTPNDGSRKQSSKKVYREAKGLKTPAIEVQNCHGIQDHNIKAVTFARKLFQARILIVRKIQTETLHVI